MPLLKYQRFLTGSFPGTKGVWVTNAGRAAVGLVIKCHSTKGCSSLQEGLSQEVLHLQTLDCAASSPGPKLRCLDTSMVPTLWESLETEAWQYLLYHSFTDTPKQGRNSLTAGMWIPKENTMNLRKAFPTTKLTNLPQPQWDGEECDALREDFQVCCVSKTVNFKWMDCTR